MIHPSVWRGVGKSFRNVKEILKKLDFEWLSIHHENEGQKVFGGFTRYDVYVARKSDSPNEITEIRDENGDIVKLNIKGMEFIPNFDIEILRDLIARPRRKKLISFMIEQCTELTNKVCPKQSRLTITFRA